nr:YitT family protein [Veillonella montpellierensis]
MNNEKKQRRSIKNLMIRYILIIVGALIYTAGLEFFLVPNHIIDGGVVGISLMAASVSGISFSFFVVLINIPFLYVGYRVLGKSFTMSTLFGILWMAIFSVLFHKAHYVVTTDPFLGAIFGGIILGVGVGLIIRNGGSLDGSEVVAIIFDKRSSFSVGEVVMALNFVILGAAGFVYSWNSAMYSLIAYFIAYKMIDITITGLEESKGVMIITDEDKAGSISDALNARLGRGVTVIYGEGGYLKQPKRILYSVVTRLEITKLKDIVYEQDDKAFITISDVHDVFGGQFQKKNIH